MKYLIYIWILLYCYLVCSYDLISQSKIVVFQFFEHETITTVDIVSILDASNYANRHGYDYKIVQIDNNYFQDRINMHQSWVKIFAIRALLQIGYDYVVYVGSNYYFGEIDVPIVDQMNKWSKSADIYLSYGTNSFSTDNCIGFQTGFQIWKNTEINLQFLTEWIVTTKRTADGNYSRFSYPYELTYVDSVIDFVGRQKVCNISPVSVNNSQEYEIFRSKSTTNTSNYLLQGEIGLIHEFSRMGIHNDVALYINQIFAGTSPLGKTIYHLTDFNDYEYFPESWIDFEVFFTNETIPVRIYHNILEQQDYELEESLKQMNLFPKEKLREVITYMHSSYERKKISYYEYIFQKKFSNYSMNHFPFIPSQSFSKKRIVTILAGRKDRIDLLMKYWNLALDANLIDEIHLWDYCREDSDRVHLLKFINPKKGIFLRTKYTSRTFWSDYYEYYHFYALIHPNDIIIKCDDDIVFIDIMKLPYFLNVIERQEDDSLAGVFFANIINNGVAAFFQQEKWNIIPRSIGDFELPEEGLCGSLWESSEKAIALHDHFLSHWIEIIRPPSDVSKDVYYLPEYLPIDTRFSINFFGMKAKHWYKLKDAGVEDELVISRILPRLNVSRNYLISNFVVSHLAFGPQLKGIEKSTILDRYYELFDQFKEMYLTIIQHNV